MNEYYIHQREFGFSKPLKVEPGVLYELMETVAYNDITEDSKRWVFARPYNPNAPILKLEDNKARDTAQICNPEINSCLIHNGHPYERNRLH